MNIADTANSNGYPITAMALCVIAYANFFEFIDAKKIHEEVADAYLNKYDPNQYNPNKADKNPKTMVPLNVVWGPAFQPADGFDTDSVMYIAKVVNSSEYFVVIRGTNPSSLKSWKLEDFTVNEVQPLNSLPGWPSNVAVATDNYISQGAFNGTSDLISLTDGNQTAVQFLQNVLGVDKDAFIYVTGHSLGGTLTPVYFSYLNAILFEGATNCNMAMWSFAGLTAGGNAFNNYINTFTTGPVTMDWRNQNSLDFAPLLFGSSTGELPSGIIDLYAANNCAIDKEAKDLLSKLFADANASAPVSGGTAPGINFYQQPPGNANLIRGVYQPDLNDPLHLLAPWIVQAFYQHHATTYYQMIYTEYQGTD
jgi:hypothetical protein